MARATTPAFMSKRLHPIVDDPEPGFCPAAKKDGSQCKLAAGFGTDHLGYGNCRFHAGNSKNEREHAREAAAEAAVAVYGLERTVDPHIALIEELHRTAGHVAWLSTVIRGVEDRMELLQRVSTGEFSSTLQPGPWLELYDRERKHLKDVAKTCIAAGIAERQVKLAEDQGRLLAQVIRGILKDLGVADKPETPEVVRRHLTAIQGGVAA